MEHKSHLKNVKISGFKSLGSEIEPIELELGRINIIIGANGAGKSNFIKER